MIEQRNQCVMRMNKTMSIFLLTRYIRHEKIDAVIAAAEVGGSFPRVRTKQIRRELAAIIAVIGEGVRLPEGPDEQRSTILELVVVRFVARVNGDEDAPGGLAR